MHSQPPITSRDLNLWTHSTGREKHIVAQTCSCKRVRIYYCKDYGDKCDVQRVLLMFFYYSSFLFVYNQKVCFGLNNY